jgi:hypothetical protein
MVIAKYVGKGKGLRPYLLSLLKEVAKAEGGTAPTLSASHRPHATLR